ncbi:MAG: hypothetical protein ACFFAS_18755 [Promethearchaeota archaeon]
MEQAPFTTSQVALFYNFRLITLVAWVIAWGEILYKDRLKLITTIIYVFGIILTIEFFLIYIHDPGTLMSFEPPNIYTPGPWI